MATTEKFVLKVVFLNESNEIEEQIAVTREGHIQVRDGLVITEIGDYIPITSVKRIKKVAV